MPAHAGGCHHLAPRRPHSRLLFAAVVASFIAAAPATSQDVSTRAAGGAAPDSAPRLRLGAVLSAVKDRNPKVAAADRLADAASARVSPAGTLPDPEVQLGFMNYRLPELRPMDPLGMVQVQVMQMFPIGGKLPLSSRIAGYQAQAVRERAADVSWEQRARAAMAFYELYAAEEGITIASATRRLVQDVASIAQSMYEVGEGNQSDLLRAQVEVARMNEEITRMEAMRAAAAARLNALLDQPHDAVVAPVALPAFPDQAPSADSIVNLALRSRPMIRAGEAERSAAETMSVRARRELLPDLVVGVQYGQRGSEMGTERMGSLMLGASVPVFAGRRQLKWREEAEAMRAMSLADLAWMKADTRGRVGEILATLNRARRLTDLYLQTVVPQAEAAVTSAVAAYRVGRIDFMNVLDNRMAVNRYRQELVTLRMEEGQAWAELEMLTGRELFDAWSIATPNRGGGTRND